MDRRENTALTAELEAVRELEDWSRGRILSVRAGGARATATTAVAAAAAEMTYRLSDDLPEWANGVSRIWRHHLGRVWAYLTGEEEQHQAMSAAIAEYLTGPFNHRLGQDGPDDFDRPQTVASYSAVCSAVFWGTDFAVTAVGQVFDCIDLKYDGEFPPQRPIDVQMAAKRIRAIVERVVTELVSGPTALRPEVLDDIRGGR